MASGSGMVSSPTPISSNTRIIVGDGSSLPITHSGSTTLPTSSSSLALNNVLISPFLIKNLISVRALTRDNPITIEFDKFGFSVKDLHTKKVVLRCDSNEDLYRLHGSCAPHCLTATTADLWHQRLGHPGRESFYRLLRSSTFICNKTLSHTCHACRVGKHVRLPFSPSIPKTSAPFQLVHCDVWTSPVCSFSGFQYYLALLDDYTHFVWTFPLRHKSDVAQTITHFHALVRTQFNRPILAFQTDNGREFDNNALRAFYSSHDIILRLSCPYTSQQNGKAERILRSLNDGLRVLLIHAGMPPTFWAEALRTSTDLLNCRPCKPKSLDTPYSLLFLRAPDYSYLRVFGCLCYPNTTSTTTHKLAPRSTACIHLGMSSEHRGYRCYDLATRRIIISRHVYFDEAIFPLRSHPSATSTSSYIPWSPDLATDDPVSLDLPTRSTASTVNTSTRSPSSTPQIQPTDPSTSQYQHTSSPNPTTSTPTTTSHVPPLVQRVVAPHHMITRSRSGIQKPNPRYAGVGTAETISPLPKSVHAALKDPNWRAAMEAEFQALLSNNTWSLVPKPPGRNIVSGKWFFRHKLKEDGTLDRYKARWVVRGFTQRPGVDYGETYSPVVKSATIRTILTIASSRDWPVHQLDVNNAFLHGILDEHIYARQPAGFIDSTHADHVCKLNKSLYVLKQAPRAWYIRFASFLGALGFTPTKSDHSLFVLRRGSESVYLLLYVDDIVVTASSVSLLKHVISKIHAQFTLKDMGALHYFLGIQVSRSPSGFFLHQHQYACDLLDRSGMKDCTPCKTPVDTAGKLSSTSGIALTAEEASSYRSIVGALQYLTMTRPDLQYAVQQACLHMQNPSTTHQALVKRILRYVRGTCTLGLHLRCSSKLDVVAYSDADWAGCPDTRCSTSGYCVYLGDAMVSWSSKRQSTVSRSSAEAEYRGVANAVAESTWLCQLLGELGCKQEKAMVVFCDNVSACYMSSNPIHHRRTKHIELDVHFVREKVALGKCRVLHVPTDQQFADVMTKGLPTSNFEAFRNSLCVSHPETAHTAGGCKR